MYLRICPSAFGERLRMLRMFSKHIYIPFLGNVFILLGQN